MARQLLKNFLGMFWKHRGIGPEKGKNLLYQRRLKRSLDEPGQVPVGLNKETAGRIFLAGLVIIFVLAPFTAVKAKEFLSLSSFSGKPGIVQVSGGGFAPGERVSIYLGGVSDQPAATATAGRNSLFGPVAVNIPADTAQGGVPVVAVGSTSKLQATNTYYVVPYHPSLNITSTANTPGSAISVSGSGFAPGETVDLSFGAALAGTAKADAKGNFGKVSLIIPSVSADTYLVRGKGASSGAETVAYFYVGGFYPVASPDNYFLLPGRTLTFSGGGFAPGETIQVFVGQSQTPSTAFTVSPKGSFTNAGAIVIPVSAAGGEMNFILKSSVTNASIPLAISVGAFNALVTPDNYYVRPGQSVKFYGRGFAPNETVQVFWGQGQDLQPVTTIVADKNGGFAGAGALTVPFNIGGTSLKFRFDGQQSRTTNALSISIAKFNPQISPSEYYLTPGKSFTIWGAGFAPSEKVDVTAAGATFTAATDKFGVFKISGPFTAPYQQGSTINAFAVGQQSEARANLTLKVGTLSPLLVPANYYNLPGDTVNIGGYGFAPGENVLAQSGRNILPGVGTDKFGNFNKYLVSLPFEGGQDIGFSFSGAKTGATASTTLSVAKLTPVLSLDNYYARPGSTIRAQARGFSRGEPVTFQVGEKILSVNADTSGTTPWTPVTLPWDITSSSTTITITGNATGVSASAQAMYAAFNTQVNPAVYYITPGKSLKFYGSGFAPRENVEISLNGQSIGKIAADMGGGFTTGDIVVPLTAKAAKFVFTGALSSKPAAVSLSLAPFEPQIYPSNYFAQPGSQVSLKGLGFAPGESVAVTFNNANATTVNADAKGNFIVGPFAVPYSGKSAGFSVAGSISGFTASVDVGIASLNPTVILSNYYVTGGAPLTISGFGFANGEKINLALGDTALGSTTADAKGNFAFKTTLPTGITGSKTISATGLSSGVSAGTALTLAQANINVTLGAYAGAPGSKVTIVGSGFLPNEPISVTTDRTGSAAVLSFNADAKGGFNNSGYVVPSAFTGGQLNFTVAGSQSKTSKTITYYITGP